MKIPLKKLTIVAESLLKEQLVKVLHVEGATGYTLNYVEGEGSRGIHASDWGGRNVQIETIVGPEVADRILGRIADQFLENYAVIAYVCDVDVLRKLKFTGGTSEEPEFEN